MAGLTARRDGTELGGDEFDRHVFGLIVAASLRDTVRPLPERLGLSPDDLVLLFAAYCPEAIAGLARGRGGWEASPVEEDLRRLLLAHRARGRPEEEWLAAIVTRRAQDPNHLWEDMGLSCRDDLNRLICRNFPSLFALNRDNMRWKKFFYRTLCEQDGMVLCKSPTCDACPDVEHCFEPGSRVLMQRAG